MPAKSKKKKSKATGKIITKNKKAFFDYFIEERFEAGISLLGSEVKSVRNGKISIRDAYVEVRNLELFLVNAHISEYTYANIQNHEPKRTRKLLMHKQEIKRISSKVREKGFTIVPLTVYFSLKGKIKVEIALVRGKKLHDKREAIKERDEKKINRYNR